MWRLAIRSDECANAAFPGRFDAQESHPHGWTRKGAQRFDAEGDKRFVLPSHVQGFAKGDGLKMMNPCGGFFKDWRLRYSLHRRIEFRCPRPDSLSPSSKKNQLWNAWRTAQTPRMRSQTVLHTKKQGRCRHAHPILASGQIECEQCGPKAGAPRCDARNWKWTVEVPARHQKLYTIEETVTSQDMRFRIPNLQTADYQRSQF